MIAGKEETDSSGHLRAKEKLRYATSQLKEGETGWMITSETLAGYVRNAMPDAQVSVTDKTGTMDHLAVRIVSIAFKDKNLLDRHRMVYQALNEPMKDGRIHALEIKADAPDER